MGKGHIQITLLRVQLSQKWRISMRKACSSHRSMANYEAKECWHLIFPVTMQGCWCSSLWLACQTHRWTDCRWGGPHSTPSSTPFFCGPDGCYGGAVPAAHRTYQIIWLVGCRGGGRWFFGQRIHWSCWWQNPYEWLQWGISCSLNPRPSQCGHHCLKRRYLPRWTRQRSQCPYGPGKHSQSGWTGP